MGWTEQARALNLRVRETYGEPGAVVYTSSGQSGVTITAYFRAAHLEVDVELGVTIASTEPMLGIFGEDLLADPGPDDFLTVGLPHFPATRRYRVKKAEPDGHGWWTVFVVRASDTP